MSTPSGAIERTRDYLKAYGNARTWGVYPAPPSIDDLKLLLAAIDNYEKTMAVIASVPAPANVLSGDDIVPVPRAILRAAARWIRDHDGDDSNTYRAIELAALRPIEAEVAGNVSVPVMSIELLKACEKARDQFAFYAAEHRNKAGNFAMTHGAHSPEYLGSAEKARKNDEFANMLSAALSPLQRVDQP